MKRFVPLIYLILFGLAFCVTGSHAQSQWEYASGLQNEIVTVLGLNDNGDLVAGVYEKGIIVSTDRGETWTQSNLTAPGPYYAITLAKDGLLFASDDDKHVYMSSDDGMSWSAVDSGLSIFPVSHLAYDAKNGLLAFDDLDIFQFDFEQQRWNVVPLPPGTTTITGYHVDQTGRIIIYDFKNWYFFTSTNTGQTWEKEYPEVEYGDYFIIATSEDGEWAAGNKSIIFTGKDFFDFTFSDIYPYSWYQLYTLLYTAPGELYAGLRQGVLHTWDNGTTWEKYIDGMTTDADWLEVYDLILDREGVMYAATERGVYRTPGPVSTNREPVSSPLTESLLDSYPNPVASGEGVTLRYTIDHASSIILHVQDILGRNVREVSFGQVHPGEHTYSIPTTGLESGMYFYSLLPSDGKPMNGKMIVR